MMENLLKYLLLYRNHRKITVILAYYVVSYLEFISKHELIHYFIFTGIGTWYEAFTTPNDPPESIPPAYIALEFSKSDIKADRFKRDAGGYIINRFVRQVSTSMAQYVLLFVLISFRHHLGIWQSRWGVNLVTQ